MKKLFLILLATSLVSCECCECGKNKNKEKLYSSEDITVTYENGIKEGKEAIIDSLANVQPVGSKTKDPIIYSSLEYGLPSGKVLDFSPTDEVIQEWKVVSGEEPPFDIYIHIKDDNGVRTVHKTNYKTWLTITEGSFLQ
jgi:hypothetical protein